MSKKEKREAKDADRRRPYERPKLDIIKIELDQVLATACKVSGPECEGGVMNPGSS
jgi:hypothetical protein